MEALGEYGVQQTFYFPLVDFGATDYESTPVTFAAGDVQVMIDGGSFSNATNTPAHEGNGVYSLALTASEMQGTRIVVTLIDQTATKLWEDQALVISTTLGGQIAATRGIYVITCDNATFTPTTTAAEFTMIAPNLTEEATADHFNGRLLMGSGSGDATQAQMTDVTDSELANSKIKLTYTALTEAPPNGSVWVVL